MTINKYVILATVAPLFFIADQGSKTWIRDHIALRRNIEVIPELFRLVHVENEGAAWGIMSDSAFRMPFFIAATSVALVVIGLYFSRIPKEQPHLALAMSSILGGALGNFVDRLRFQSVTDFLDFFIGFEPVSGWLISVFRSNHWPSFNIADVAIVCGLFIILYDMFFLEPRRMKSEAAQNQGEAVATAESKPKMSAQGGSY